MSPTQRTLAFLRKLGWTAQIVERWNAYARVRQDLFGIIDIVAVRASDNGCWGVQATSSDHMSDHVQKALEEPKLKTWLLANNSFSVVTWAKQGPRGKRKVYKMRETEIHWNGKTFELLETSYDDE